MFMVNELWLFTEEACSDNMDPKHGTPKPILRCGLVIQTLQEYPYTHKAIKAIETQRTQTTSLSKD